MIHKESWYKEAFEPGSDAAEEMRSNVESLAQRGKLNTLDMNHLMSFIQLGFLDDFLSSHSVADMNLDFKKNVELFRLSVTHRMMLDFSGVSFMGADLSGLTFYGPSKAYPAPSRRRNPQFQGVYFKGANFSNCKFSPLHFLECDLTGAIFTGSYLDHVTFQECYIDRADFSQSEGVFIDFYDSSAIDLDFRNSKVKDLAIRGYTDARGSNFSGSILPGFQVEMGGLSGSLFQGVDFESSVVRFDQADVRNADFSAVTGHVGLFVNSHVNSAKFVSGSYKVLNFVNCFLEGASFKDLRADQVSLEGSTYDDGAFEDSLVEKIEDGDDGFGTGPEFMNIDYEEFYDKGQPGYLRDRKDR